LERSIHARYYRHRDLTIFLAGLRSGKRWSGDSEVYKADAILAIISELTTAIADITEGATDYWDNKPDLTAPILRIRSVRKTPGKFTVARPVIRLDTLEQFPSAAKAAQSIGASTGNLSSVCNGHRAAVKGIRFAYVDDYESGHVHQYVRRTGEHSPQARKVVRLDTGEVFGTVSAASMATGVHSGKVVAICKGKRGSANGFRFAYLPDYEAGILPSFVQRLEGKDHYRSRKVRCVESGVIYETITDAARATSAHVSSIVRSCKSSKSRAGGFHWAYV
jgi:hypothetical protein